MDNKEEWDEVKKFISSLAITNHQKYQLGELIKHYASQVVGDKDKEIANYKSQEELYLAAINEQSVLNIELQSQLLQANKEVDRLKLHLDGMYANNKEGWTKVEYYEKQVEYYKALAEAAELVINEVDSTLSEWENYLHDENGKRITDLRKRIAKLTKTTWEDYQSQKPDQRIIEGL